MTPTSTVQITISPEATAYVNELGLQEPFQQMLEHAQQTIPGIREISVTLQLLLDTGDDPRVILDVFTNTPQHELGSLCREWRRWVIETFPPEVFTHFCLLGVYGPPDAR